MMAILLLVTGGCVILPVAAGVTFQSSSPQTIVQGDGFSIHGTGATNDSIAIRVIGRDYFEARLVTPDEKGVYTYVLEPGKTKNFSSGQYAVVIQDPGANRQFEITSLISDTGNITFRNNGVVYADVGYKQNLGTDVHPVLAQVLDTKTNLLTDDIITPYYFFVELPFLHFDRAADSGSNVTLRIPASEKSTVISGTTNMGTENILTVMVNSADTNKLLISTKIPVVSGNNGTKNYLNRWSYELDPSGLPVGDYFMTVGWQKDQSSGTGTILFTVQ
jgi:hypothetical protein